VAAAAFASAEHFQGEIALEPFTNEMNYLRAGIFLKILVTDCEQAGFCLP